MNRKVCLKYTLILIILFLPLFGLIGHVISRNIITPNDQFFVIDLGDTPEINVDSWNLNVFGQVNFTQNYNYSSFTALPSKEVIATIQCVEGPTGTAIWKGVPVKDLLDLAELKQDAMEVIFYGYDGYTSSLTIEEINDENVILAYEMNGEPLPIEQGYPLRVVAPNHYGYKWVKWVVRLEVVNYDYVGFWESRGWNDSAYTTPLSDWIVHALLLAVSFLFGGLSIMSGLRTSPVTQYFRDLPKFFNTKFHKLISITYFFTSTSTFLYWILFTILNRGAVFYTLHGILSLISIITLVPTMVTGFKKIKKRDMNHKTWHYKWALASFFLFLFSIFLGFLLVLTGFIRLY
ncbi:MAG: hypothetical protein EU552_02780 [Promethearchaeota archaeon]|nr:MAG: hypothetical protein EU552_02780 [Candidatus Lokiarchaeota archaeon]